MRAIRSNYSSRAIYAFRSMRILVKSNRCDAYRDTSVVFDTKSSGNVERSKLVSTLQIENTSVGVEIGARISIRTVFLADQHP